MNGIKFVYTSSEAISGTQSYHQFEPSTDSAVKMKRISYVDDFELEFDFLEKKTRVSNTEPKNITSKLFALVLV